MRRSVTNLALIAAAVFLVGCTQIERPKVEPFFAASAPPTKQELRWSNGKLPKSIDPARAIAAPETDVVRAVYEGLTDLDSKTLRETPAVAEKWESSDDARTWTFHLRKDARWSNGERVTTNDFVRSWKRLRDTPANQHLYQNIVGMRSPEVPGGTASEPTDFLDSGPNETEPQTPDTDGAQSEEEIRPTRPVKSNEQKFGVEAIDDSTLKVSLELPDKDFPRLVANPVFRPVYGDTAKLEKPRPDPSVVTNGAFRIAKVEDSGVTLERSENHWDKRSVALERIYLKAANTSDAALEAYRKGDVDIVTNAAFEPAALKVLTPYEDFRRTTHNALNFYEFNTVNPPFDDRRVREALAIAVDREKLVQSDLEGSTQPAYLLFPQSDLKGERLSLDIAKAKDLLAKAGFANGVAFPPIRLVVNRNDTQHRIARSVARMWKQNLGIDTSIIVKENTEIESVRNAGDYDVIRRGVVMPVNDELVNLKAILGSVERPVETPEKMGTESKFGPSAAETTEAAMDETPEGNYLIAEGDAMFELRVMPLYFPSSYSLVKPYVRGFEMNSLDAPNLKEVSIDNEWRAHPPK
jgi:oligopeptide transport system substrate-binding protein